MDAKIMEAVSGEVFAVWFLIGAALVFWMQAGFAMVESGFARAKNAGNILMKNLMDFCIGTCVFILIGFGLLFGEDMVGLIGKPGLDIFTSYESFDWSNFVFNLVFCATTATIVSGAMAERVKFISYCVYSGVISALIYPIEAHWIWGGGWLSQLGFHDFAGSCCIHMVGGIAALVGAKILGPRIGKFIKDESGKIVKVNAFPGHNIPIGALGVFILWFGWYGFNGAACTSVDQLGSVFLTTTVAPAVATVVCMIFTWLKYGKPDVSMCLNASLAGLVGITAPCDVTDCFGAICIGLVSGLLVVFGVWLLDYKLRIDDPVGAVAVHCLNGIWGTVAVGLFATPSAPGYSIADANGNVMAGLFYGGGFKLLGVQLLGFASVAAWAAVTMIIVFLIIKATIGLRVTTEEEITGLDATEHGLPSAYGGMAMLPEPVYDDGVAYVSGDVPMAEAVEVKEVPGVAAGAIGAAASEAAASAAAVTSSSMKTAVAASTGTAGSGLAAETGVMSTGAISGVTASAMTSESGVMSINAGAQGVTLEQAHTPGGHKFTKVEIICREAKLEALKAAMMKIGITGMTVSHVLGCGLQKGKLEYYRGVAVEASLLPKIQVDIVVSKVPVADVIATAKKVLYTGHIGDGKIFVYDVENVVKVRTGEEGYDALQDVE